MNVYYVADVRSVLERSPAMPTAVIVRPIAEADIPALAELYLRAFSPPVAGSLEEALAEMKAEFDGKWGVLWTEASPAAWVGDELASVVLTVRRPSWADAPDCPWLTDVFTDPRYRRNGIARSLLAAACRVLSAVGEPRIGLTVERTNVAAVALYRSLGFAESA